MGCSRRLSWGLFGPLALAWLVGCAPRRAPSARPALAVVAPIAPAWLDHEELADGLAGTGLAQANPQGDQAGQRAAALADARVRLKGKLKTRVERLVTELNRRMLVATPGQPIQPEVLNRLITHLSAELAAQASDSIQFWTDPADATLYAWVGLTRQHLDRVLAAAAQGQLRKAVDQGEPLGPALAQLEAAIADT